MQLSNNIHFELLEQLQSTFFLIEINDLLKTFFTNEQI